MTDYTEAADAIRADESSAAPAEQKVRWAVTDKDGDCAQFCKSEAAAQALVAFKNAEFAMLGPFRLWRMVEQPE